MKFLDDPTELLTKPTPPQTDSYVPISNKQVVDTIEGTLNDHGFTVIDQQFKANRNLTQMVGAFTIATGNKDYKMNVGFRNSYDKSLSFGIAVGAKVMACKNLELSSFRKIRKHTANVMVDFYKYVNLAANKLDDEYNNILSTYIQLKRKGIPVDKVEQLLGQLFYREELLNTQQLNNMKAELKKNEHADLVPSGCHSGYGFHMALTNSLKSSHPIHMIQDHVSAYNFSRKHILQK